MQRGSEINMIQVAAKKFMAALNAGSPDELRDLFMSFGVKAGDAWDLAVQTRQRWGHGQLILGANTKMITIGLPQDIELDFGS